MTEESDVCGRPKVDELIVHREDGPHNGHFVVESKNDALTELFEIQQNILMPSNDCKEIQRCLGLNKLKRFSPLLRAMGVTYFYRKNYRVAAAVFDRMRELDTNDLDVQLMAAECEIMIGSSAYRIACERFVETVKASSRMTKCLFQRWDELLRQADRHVGRIIVQFAACRRYVDDKGFCILTPYAYFLKMKDGYDDMLKAAEIPNDAYVSIKLLREILDAMNRKTDVVCTMPGALDPNIHIGYIRAVCHNIIARLYICAKRDDDAASVAKDGIQALLLNIGLGDPLKKKDLLGYWSAACLICRGSTAWVGMCGYLLENYVIASNNVAVKSGDPAKHFSSLEKLCEVGYAAYQTISELGNRDVTEAAHRIRLLQTKFGDYRKALANISRDSN